MTTLDRFWLSDIFFNFSIFWYSPFHISLAFTFKVKYKCMPEQYEEHETLSSIPVIFPSITVCMCALSIYIDIYPYMHSWERVPNTHILWGPPYWLPNSVFQIFSYPSFPLFYLVSLADRVIAPHLICWLLNNIFFVIIGLDL